LSEVAAVIAAAGTGTRFGAPVPKVFAALCGQPLLTWSVRAFEDCPDVDTTVVVAPPDHLQRARDLCVAQHLTKVLAVLPGGEHRMDSVRAGLDALLEQPPALVCVHDGARPLVDLDTIVHSIQAARLHGAAVAAFPVVDTIKQAGPDGRIIATPPRDELYQAQTPQTFSFDLLLSAYRYADRHGLAATDDASLVEQMGETVYVSEGHPDNLKVTTPDDLARAEWILRRRLGQIIPQARVGVGHDVHALVEGRPLILGGVDVPHPQGLAGHSDADVLFHAISDALLGAAALGDIGQHFPDTDPQWAGADSGGLCRRVADLLAEAGWLPSNVDATLICEHPRLAPHILQMRSNIAAALDLPLAAVSVKATTTEGLGFAGRGEGIAAEAVVLIQPTAQ
jgi:2-C-methyl-D-erythritol 4-phosphate cytidylyltransferase/2-C-methyl-D-erythritol 2,4-cyclodiphosphate synthase